MRQVLLGVLAMGLFSCHTDFASRVGDGYVNPPVPIPTLSIEALSRDGAAIAIGRVGTRTVAFVADEDESALHTIDLDQRIELARTDLEGRPAAALVLPNGKLAVALRDAASVVILAVTDVHEPLTFETAIDTADEPIALATSPDAATLWIASGVGRALEGFTIHSLARRATIPLGREPRALTISNDGARAYVGYMSDLGVGVIDLHTREVMPATITHDDSVPGFKAPPRFARQTFSLVRLADSDTILAPLQLVNPGEPMVISNGYGSSEMEPVVFDLARVDGRTGIGSTTAANRFVDSDCRLPRGAALDPRTEHVAVACLGSNAIAFFESKRPFAANMVTARQMLDGGPNAITYDPVHESFVVLPMFTRRLHIVHERSAPVAIALSHSRNKGLAPAAAEGRKLFFAANDDRISADGRACASCHPDGRDDGLVWATPNGPRQTVFLAGRLAREAPFGWDAKHNSIAAHVKVTMRNLRGAGLPAADIEKLAAYLVTIPPPPRKLRPLTPVEEKGKAIFASSKSGCASCHGDATAHDVASATKVDKNKSFLAPSLTHVAVSAPYFHDGRYPTLAAMLRATDNTMASPDLGDDEITALEAYLRTL